MEKKYFIIATLLLIGIICFFSFYKKKITKYTYSFKNGVPYFSEQEQDSTIKIYPLNESDNDVAKNASIYDSMNNFQDKK